MIFTRATVYHALEHYHEFGSGGNYLNLGGNGDWYNAFTRGAEWSVGVFGGKRGTLRDLSPHVTSAWTFKAQNRGPALVGSAMLWEYYRFNYYD